MLFSSMTFIYFFLPIVAAAYFVLPFRKWRNGVLLVASLVFYSWGEPKYLFLMLAASMTAYLCGFGIDKLRKHKGLSKAFLILGVVLMISDLMFFKYLNFFAENIENALNVHLGIREIALPIGISFFTFQILSYLIDLYRGEVALQKSFFRFTLYVSFFPQLIAGPIVRYKTVEEEILNRKENLLEAAGGLRRFAVGLAKKVVIANNAAVISEYIYQSEFSGTSALWLAAICYAFQIYFDFSGYSDMAIGLGRIFGFHFLENFNYPYIARSVTDFWRRWHISLSSWFRDYVYIPLGGNRVGKIRLVLNILIVWTLTGFWHGAQWNFVLWGAYYAVLLIIEKLFLKKGVDALPKLFGWIYAMFFVVIGWVIFNTTDMASLGDVLKNMFLYVKTDWESLISSGTSLALSAIALPLAAIFSFPIAKKIKLRDDKFFGALVLNTLSLALLAVSIICIISSSYNPFIYFRF